ncbi:hypothetical protein T484DRAFT_2400562 [Baffinella frigidus]|nr:hypothetical protein T484DRAFT_2400562 [Cryptophyta sp. CCMP2293]
MLSYVEETTSVEEGGGARRGRWVKRLAVAGAVLMACLVAAVVVAPSSAPAELLMGGGFLGDLPHGGENGHSRVNDLKSDNSQGQTAAQKQASLALSIMDGAGGSSAKARTAALAAAAEIAKVLDVPSAQSIVEGHGRAPRVVAPTTGDGDTTGLASSKAKDPTPWLKTPKEYDEYTYSKRKTLLRPVVHSVSAYNNDQDDASQVSVLAPFRL